MGKDRIEMNAYQDTIAAVQKLLRDTAFNLAAISLE